VGQRSGDGWEALPPELLDAYDRWHLSTGYDTTLVRWLEGGTSEAPVVLVAQFEPHATSRQAVLKFMRRPGTGDDALLTAGRGQPDQFLRRTGHRHAREVAGGSRFRLGGTRRVPDRTLVKP
jgi:hypothetical protein